MYEKKKKINKGRGCENKKEEIKKKNMKNKMKGKSTPVCIYFRVFLRSLWLVKF